MLKWVRVWIRSWVRSPKSDLAEILASPDNQEIFLGVKRSTPPSPEAQKRDADRVIHYSTSTDYSIWAKEAWSEVLRCVDQLTKDGLTDRQVDFYRGSLAQTIKLLRISFMARNYRDMSAAQDQKKPVVRGVV